MKIKFTMDCGYIGSDYEEEVEELATDFFGKIFMVVMVMK